MILENIGAVNDRQSAGKQIHYKIYLVHNDQIDRTKPFPQPNASREIGALPLKEGQNMHCFDVINYSPEDKSTGTKGDITSTVENSMTMIVGGNRNEISNFLENCLGDLFYLVIHEIDSGLNYLYGREFTPMALSAFERTNGKESRSASLTFSNSSFFQPLIYVGALQVEPPVQIAADATTLILSTSRQYVTSSANTKTTAINAFTGLRPADEGRTIEIIGGGGTNASTMAEVPNAIILKGAQTWTASAGSRIVLRVLDESTLVEISRT